MEEETKPVICQSCQYEFGLGDKIYLLHIWVFRRDLCKSCMDRVMGVIDSFQKSEQIASL